MGLVYMSRMIVTVLLIANFHFYDSYDSYTVYLHQIKKL